MFPDVVKKMKYPCIEFYPNNNSELATNFIPWRYFYMKQFESYTFFIVEIA